MKELLSLSTIEGDFPDLYKWVRSITRYNDFDKFVVVERDEPHESRSVRIKFWTSENEYSIRASLADADYLGCVVSARKPRTGEDWTRGNDLPDGRYCEETWLEIVYGILAYELSKTDIYIPVAMEEHSVFS